MTIPERLVEIRTKNGYTRKRLAEELHKPYKTITNYESGEREPGHEYIIEIAKKFGVSTDYILGTSESPFAQTKTAPLCSSEAIQLAQDYDFLDGHGKRVVRVVADEEKSRCLSALKEKQRKEPTETAEELAPETVYFTVPCYESPMSAGTGQLAGDGLAEDYRLIKAPPRGTSYIAPVCGDSMEPTFRDGDRLFIHSTVDIRPGQIGVFFMDGQQWVKELGNGVLLSHNKKYAPVHFTEDVQCQGLVLGVCDDSYFE